MNIVCLGWGSLIWNPSGLPVREWKKDGPSLPVEFARQSENGRLTLVILDQGERVCMLYAALEVPDLGAAILALSTREGCAKRRIGYWTGSGAREAFAHSQDIGSWANERSLDAVVWTALPAKFGGVDGRMPNAEEAISYLATLEGDKRRMAEEYVRRVPAQIRTQSSSRKSWDGTRSRTR